MRRMNYNPFEKPFASGKLTNISGFNRFVLDNPLEKGIYLFEIVDNEVGTSDIYGRSGILKISLDVPEVDKVSEVSEFYGQGPNCIISWTNSLLLEDRKVININVFNDYQIDLSSFSYTIKLYKIA